MRAVIFGAGRIGCGFAGLALQRAGYEITFVTRNPELVRHLNAVGRYRVRLVDGRRSEEHVVAGVRALCVADEDGVRRQLAVADLIATAVGAGRLPDVAPLIAAGLRQAERTVNVIAFENLVDAGPALAALVARELPAAFSLRDHGFSGAVVDRAVSRRWGDPRSSEPLVFIGDPPDRFYVHGPSLRGTLPPVPGMVEVEDFEAWFNRKLYTFSAGHATTAYIGYVKGYHYVHAAIRDPEVRATALTAMREGQSGLAARYGRALAGDERDLEAIVSRFENAALSDSVDRVARDPRRKLGPRERLAGGARLAAVAGVAPTALPMAAAAALCFAAGAGGAAESLAMGWDNAEPQRSGLGFSKAFGVQVASAWQEMQASWRPDTPMVHLSGLDEPAGTRR